MERKYSKIKQVVESIVKEACYSKNNVYTYTAWTHHVLPVVNHGLKLGKKLKADLEVIELSALLHDYSVIFDFKNEEDHHIHSARMAREILKKEKYNDSKIELIENCILSHRARVHMKRDSLESQILASADAMSHITELADMFYLTYGVHKFKTKEGAEWLLAKLKRSWTKIMPEGKKIVSREYKTAINILKQAII